MDAEAESPVGCRPCRDGHWPGASRGATPPAAAPCPTHAGGSPWTCLGSSSGCAAAPTKGVLDDQLLCFELVSLATVIVADGARIVAGESRPRRHHAPLLRPPPGDPRRRRVRPAEPG
jgi:hypothetical protein